MAKARGRQLLFWLAIIKINPLFYPIFAKSHQICREVAQVLQLPLPAVHGRSEGRQLCVKLRPVGRVQVAPWPFQAWQKAVMACAASGETPQRLSARASASSFTWCATSSCG